MRKKVHVLWHEIKRLKSEECRTSLRWYVLNYIQRWYKADDEIKCFFRQVCISGESFHLIYYREAEKFFNKFYEDIEDLREDWELTVGESLKIEGDLRIYMSQFAFRQVADQIECELCVKM